MRTEMTVQDGKRLEEIAARMGSTPGQVLSELLEHLGSMPRDVQTAILRGEEAACSKALEAIVANRVRKVQKRRALRRPARAPAKSAAHHSLTLPSAPRGPALASKT